MATDHIEHSIEPRAGAACECTAATTICSTHVYATSTNEYCAPVMMCELSGGALLDGAEGGTVCACEKVYVSEYNAPTTPEVVVDVISDVCLEVSTPVDEGGLGAGVTCIAALGQLALAVQVQMGIMKGELDPNKQRVDPYGGRKQGELEKMLGLMLGDKEAGNGNQP